MAYLLDGNTLKNPHSFVREIIETGTKHTMIDGTTKKSVKNRKERFVLEYRYLTRSQASTLFSIFNQETTVNFEITETNLTISSTPVHVEIERREYNARGNEYREDLTIILTEVL